MTVTLETERLLLREFTADDVDLIVELDADPEVRRYVDRPEPTTWEQAAEGISRFHDFYAQSSGFGFWAAHEKATGAFIGWFHFHPSREDSHETALGYRLKRAYWGRGYATEGSRALIRRGFEQLGVQTVIATALEDNAASRRVMEKAGLRLVGGYEYKPGMPAVKYALTRDEWQMAEGATERA
jgi:RimJ/RimL family protein N-acetyltransferase